MTLTFGKDSNNNIIPLLLDASGRVIVTSEEPSGINPTGSLGYYYNGALPAGQSDQTIFTVPASQRYILTGLTIMYGGTVAPVTLYPKVQAAGNLLYIDQVIAPVNFYKYFYGVSIVVEAGWTINCLIQGATLNDVFEGSCALSRIK